MSDTLLLVGTTRLNADLRHQVPVEIHDPVLFFERDGRRTVVTSVLEEPRIRASGGLDEVLLLEELGSDALTRKLGSRALADRAAMVVALKGAGVTQATVPSGFPLGFARELEDAGVALEVDDGCYVELRRHKTAAELEGVRRAQAAADGAVELVRRTLAEAEVRDGDLHGDGQPLTSERLKHAVRAELAARDATLDEFILSCGPQTAIGHHTGAGVLRPGEPILVDLWPTDRASGCCTDMTRTFVVGDPPAELVERHALCRHAFDELLPEVRPGATCEDLHTLVCELFEVHGHPTPLSRPGEVLTNGFPYPLGHGLGLELHESPGLRQGEHATLVEGEVLAIEPALYEQGFGGVRLEDVYVVTADGAERLGTLDHELLIR